VKTQVKFKKNNDVEVHTPENDTTLHMKKDVFDHLQKIINGDYETVDYEEDFKSFNNFNVLITVEGKYEFNRIELC